MSVLVQAHIAGFPVEETLLAVLPAAGLVSGWLFVRWKDRLRDRAQAADEAARQVAQSRLMAGNRAPPT